MGRFPKMVVPQNGWFQWFIVENPMRIDYWGVYTHFGKVTESDLIRLWKKEAGANQLKPTDQKPDLKWKHSKNQRKKQFFPMRSVSFVIFICPAGEHIAILTCLIARLYGLQTCLILAGSNVRSATQQQQHWPTDELNTDSEEEVSLEAFSLAMKERIDGRPLYRSIPQCFWGQLKYAKIWSVCREPKLRHTHSNQEPLRLADHREYQTPFLVRCLSSVTGAKWTMQCQFLHVFHSSPKSCYFYYAIFDDFVPGHGPIFHQHGSCKLQPCTFLAATEDAAAVSMPGM